jgi:hypothetical protein
MVMSDHCINRQPEKIKRVKERHPDISEKRELPFLGCHGKKYHYSIY